MVILSDSQFEYGFFPVWIYDENDEFVDNDLLPYLIGDINIEPEFVSIQGIYDGLYLDDGKELFLAVNLLKNIFNNKGTYFRYAAATNEFGK